MSYGQYRALATADHARLLAHWLHQDLLNEGENRLGVEFKCDRLFRRTGNLYIETAEKARPRPGAFAPSGIYRDDNSWLWVQGDEVSVAVFLKADLVKWDALPYWTRIEKETSQGWLLPWDCVHLLALCIIERPGEPNGNGAAALDAKELFGDG